MHRDSCQHKRYRDLYSRRCFLGCAGGALAAGAFRSLLAQDVPPSDSTAVQPHHAPLIWGYLLHLSFNMWCDRPFDDGVSRPTQKELCSQPYLRFDDKLWEELTTRMANAGMNMVVIDLGDGVQYQSHPEIAVQGAWSTERLRKELARLRRLGLEPIPKLNFSTAHNLWLGAYSRQVSTSVYYKVCEDLIDEVIRLFDKPRLFHLGCDEETIAEGGEKAYPGNTYVVARQYELWWHDVEFLVKQVEQRGVRPWIWSDYVWKHGDVFFERMPKSVLLSNWYYDSNFKDSDNYVRWYGELDKHGYDQLPTGSNWAKPENFGRLVKYCQKKIAPERLKGFLQTSWTPTLEKFRQRHIEAIDQVAVAIAACVSQSKQPDSGH